MGPCCPPWRSSVVILVGRESLVDGTLAFTCIECHYQLKILEGLPWLNQFVKAYLA